MSDKNSKKENKVEDVSIKTIDDITPEIRAKIPEYKARAIEGVLDGGRYKSFDINKARDAVNWNYNAVGMKEPIILVAENPLEQQLMFNMMNKNLDKYRTKIDSDVLRLRYGLMTQEDKNAQSKELCDMIFADISLLTKNEIEELRAEYNNSYVYTLNVYSDIYFSWLKFVKDEFKIHLPVEGDIEEAFALQRASCVYSVIFNEDVAVVCKYPLEVHQDESNEFALNNAFGEAIKWSYNVVPFPCHYINGRYLEPDLYASVVDGTLTFDDFVKIDNEDIKGCIVTLIKARGGNEALMNFLGAELVDEQDIVHANGYTEHQRLFRTKESFSWAHDGDGNAGAKLAWNEQICPSTGNTYLIETKPCFDKVLDSAKWLRPSWVPLDKPYLWQSAS